MKKKLKMFSLLVLLLIINIGIVYAVTTDTNAPTVSKLTFEKTENLKPGDKVYLDTDMKDDVSGIETVYVWVNKIILNDGTYYNNIEETPNALVVQFDEEKPYVIIPDTYTTGAYYVKEIQMFDKEDNRSNFYTKDQMQYFQEFFDSVKIDTQIKDFDEWVDSLTGNYEPERTEINVKFNVDAGAPDTESPFLASVGILPETMNYSDTITYEFKVSDNNHKMRVSVGLSNGTSFVTNFDDTNSSIVKLDFKPSQYKALGTIYVDYVILEDLYGNVAFYLRDNYQGNLAVDYYQGICQTCESLHDIKIEVIDDGSLDEEPPTLEDVTISKNKFPIPSFAKIELKATDNKELSQEAVVVFKSDNKELSTTLYLEEDGIYRGELNISQYAEPGTYKLTDVVIGDAAGNGLLYCNYDYKYKDKDLEIDLEFELTAKFTPDITTSTIAKDLIDQIKNAEDNAKIAIDATGNTIVKKEVFDAIKGTNKTIYVESNGIEWIFNGKDIKETKDIDVSLEIYYDYNYNELDTEKYSGKALILKFAENGELPAPANIRIKLDYTLRQYIGEEVYVYYYDKDDKNNQVFSDIIGKSLKLNDNGWFEFTINHNSAYVFTNTKPAEKYIKENQELIEKNNTTTTEITNKVEKKNNKKTIIIGLGIIIVLGIIGLIIIVINLKKRKTTE